MLILFCINSFYYLFANLHATRGNCLAAATLQSYYSLAFCLAVAPFKNDFFLKNAVLKEAFNSGMYSLGFYNMLEF